jgi:peptidyl-prolyl cis-trans isomerase B (cyclophilin B)
MNKQEKTILIVGILVAIAAGGLTFFLQNQDNEEVAEIPSDPVITSDNQDEPATDPNSTITPDAMEIDPNFSQTRAPQSGDLVADIQTNKGTIKLRLFPEKAPKTVENFQTLANENYYDGVIFHRIIDGFMIQGGDPEGTGMGGESAFGGTFDNEITADLSNIRGSISMANAGIRDGQGTNGSQFFINQADNTQLNGYNNDLTPKDCSLPRTSCHSVFGQVYEGMDLVDQLAAVETDAGDKPLEEIVMEEVTVYEYE